MTLPNQNENTCILEPQIDLPAPGNFAPPVQTVPRPAVMVNMTGSCGDMTCMLRAIAESTVSGLRALREEFERNYLSEVVSRSRGNVSEAARIAKVTRPTMYDLLKKHKLMEMMTNKR